MNDYGAGLFIQNFRGWQYVNHSGATAGYRANLEAFPELKLSIAFLTNTSEFDTAKISVAQAIRNIFVRHKEGNPVIKSKDQTLVPEAKLSTHSGWYKNDRDGTGVLIKLKNKSLMFDDAVLLPQTENQFKFAKGDRLIDWRDTGGLLLIIPQRDTIHYSKVDSSDYSTLSLTEYAGKYYSTETNSSITVVQKNNKLMIHIKPNEDDQLIPTYKDAFAISRFGGNLYFIKNNLHKIVAMNISIPRARNVTFEKLK
jgi:hypothetical protein